VSIRVGLIGAGRVAAQHVAAVAGAPDARVVAVCDPRVERARAIARDQGGAAVYATHEQLLADAAVDAVVIAVPHRLHAPLALAAIAAGKPVFMDKPLALDPEEGEALCEAVDAAGLPFMLCHNLLFHPAVARARELLDARPLGRLTVSAAWSHGWLDLDPGDFRHDAEATGGGAWIDCASHLLYALEHLVGPIAEVRAFPAAGPSRIGAEDAAGGIARFAEGSVATLTVSYADRLAGHAEPWPAGWRAGYLLQGTDGSLRVEVLPHARVELFDGARSRVETFDNDFSVTFAGAMREFLAAVAERRTPSVGCRDGLRMLSLISASMDEAVHA
jgi:predicted dehydrogenase